MPTKSRWPASMPASTTGSRPALARTWAARSVDLWCKNSCRRQTWRKCDRDDTSEAPAPVGALALPEGHTVYGRVLYLWQTERSEQGGYHEDNHPQRRRSMRTM